MAAQYLLSVPSKATKSVEFVGPFNRFVGNNYDEQPSRYQDAISEFQGLREATVVKIPDRHETGLDLITRYYDQLTCMENKLPISESQIRIKFHWTDAFAKGGLFGGKKEAAQVSSVYERCCVLFNTGALQSQIAKSQNFDNDDGLKSAARHFQGAAGVFQYLQEHVFAHLQRAPTPDLSAESTTALMQLMLAQAQESFCIKACKDRIKDLLIAKIAMQCSDLYAEAYSNMQVGTVKPIWDKGWLTTVTAKQAYFHCVAQHRMGLVAQGAKNYGESVARMKKAVELLSEAERKGEGIFKPYEVTQTVKRDYEAANKDNNFIYNDLVPEFGTLEPPGKATLAKPTPFTSPSANFVDLFASLVPLAVSQAQQAYGVKKDDLVNTECEKLREATAELNELLASKNLPAAIEDTGGDSLPESIQEKAAAVSSEGGAGPMEQKINGMPELVERNREILTETVRMLDEEEREDTELKSRFKEKWTRQPSGGLAENLRKEVSKYQTILETASRADQTVRQKFESHREAIVLLGKPVAELQAALPKAGALSPRIQGSQCVQDLRTLMEEVMTLKAEREVIERTLRENVADITGKFLRALKDFGEVDEETLSEAHLRTEYGSVQTQVQESLAKQPQLVERITSASGQFEQLTAGQSVGEREAKLKELATGYDAFQQLQSNVTEGTKFYNDLTPLLLRVQSKISDFVFARRTEKDDLLKDLQKSIANQPSAAPPVNPEYQQQTRQPPQRPPPPQMAPQPPPQTQLPRPPAQPRAPPTAPPPASAPQPMGGHPSYHPMPPAQGYQPYAPYGAPPQHPPHPAYYQQPPPGSYYPAQPGAPYGQPPPPGPYGNPPPGPYGHPYGHPPPGQYHPQQPYQPPQSRR